MADRKNDLDAKREALVETIVQLLLSDISCGRKLRQVLDTTKQFKKLRAEGHEVKVCAGGLLRITGGEKKSMPTATRKRKQFCVGALVAGLIGCFFLSGYSEVLERSALASPRPAILDLFDDPFDQDLGSYSPLDISDCRAFTSLARCQDLAQ